MAKFSEKAVENYKQGFSCSESIVKAAIDLELADDGLLDVATSFSGGMSCGCLCGAIAGAQMVLGQQHGRNKTNKARQKAKDFIEEFCKDYKVSCCRALTKGLEFGSVERKENCTKIVKECGEILEKLL